MPGANKARPDVWPQDKLVRPVSATNAVQNPQLATVDKEHYTYGYTVATANTPNLFIKSFQVDPSCVFWISNFSMGSFLDSTQATNTAVGFVSVTDNTTGYQVLENVYAGIVGTLQGNPANSNGAQNRNILPMPYGIGAGASFTIQIRYDGTTAARGASTQQMTVEGFKDFTFNA